MKNHEIMEVLNYKQNTKQIFIVFQVNLNPIGLNEFSKKNTLNTLRF